MKSIFYKTFSIAVLVSLVMSCNFASSFTPTSSSTTEPSLSQTEQVSIENNILQSSLLEFPNFSLVKIPSTNITDNPTKLSELARWGKEPWGASVEFVPDGKTIAINANNGIAFYDATTYEERQFINTPNPVLSISLSPDGKQIVAAVSVNTFLEIEIYDVTTGEIIQDLGQAGIPTYSPDSKKLAAPSNNQVNVFSVDNQELLYSIDVSASSIAYSNDGQYIAAGDYKDNSVKIYNAASGELIREMEGHKDSIGNLVFSPDDNQLATRAGYGDLIVWNTSNGQILYSDNFSSNQISYSSDGSQLIIADNNIEIRDTSTFELIDTFDLGGYTTTIDFDFSPDGQQLVSTANNGTVIFWDVQSRTPKHILESVIKIKYLPNNRLLDIDYKNAIRIWDFNTGNLLFTLESGRTNYTSIVDEIRYSPDGSQIASIYRDDTVQVWDINTGKSLHTFEKHEGRVVDVGYLPDGWQVVIDTENNAVIQLWDLDTDELIRTIETGHTDDISSATYSNDGQLLATGSRDKTSKLWNVQTGQLLYTLSKQYSSIIDKLVFSPVGKLLIAIDVYGAASIWDINTGNSPYDLDGNFPVFSPDGKLIVARLVANNGFKIVLINSNNGEWLATIDNNSLILGFSPDGKLLITDSSNGIFQIWGVSE